MKKIFKTAILSLSALIAIPSIAKAAPTEGTDWAKVVARMDNNSYIQQLKKNSTVSIVSDDSKMVVTVVTEKLTQDGKLIGDVNGDSKITAEDADLIQKYILGSVELSSDELKIADVNGDNIVDALDMEAIQKHVNGSQLIQTKYTLTYRQANNIVTFLSENSNDSYLATVEAYVNNALISSTAEYYGYDVEKFMSWLNKTDTSKLTIGNDGIEFTTYTVSGIVSMKKLQINVECGISSYVPEKDPEPTPEPEPTPTPEPTPEEDVETKVENPKTGLYISLASVVFLAVAGITLGVSKNKNYFNKI